VSSVVLLSISLTVCYDIDAWSSQKSAFLNMTKHQDRSSIKIETACELRRRLHCPKVFLICVCPLSTCRAYSPILSTSQSGQVADLPLHMPLLSFACISLPQLCFQKLHCILHRGLYILLNLFSCRLGADSWPCVACRPCHHGCPERLPGYAGCVGAAAGVGCSCLCKLPRRHSPVQRV
jgi:hypothetical protein